MEKTPAATKQLTPMLRSRHVRRIPTSLDLPHYNALLAESGISPHSGQPRTPRASALGADEPFAIRQAPDKFRYRINAVISHLSRRIEMPCTLSMTPRSRTVPKTMDHLGYAQNTPNDTMRHLSETQTAIELKRVCHE